VFLKQRLLFKNGMSFIADSFDDISYLEGNENFECYKRKFVLNDNILVVPCCLYGKKSSWQIFVYITDHM
jgi:hypothetical protein